MLLKNLRTFLKHLQKHKLYTAISIFGFAISLMFVILLGVYVKNELSVDTFHSKKERLYRMTHGEHAGFGCPSGGLLMSKFPEIESYSRLFYSNGFLEVNKGEKVKFKGLMVDSSFFRMFDFKLLEGAKETVLKDKMSIVITRSYALKLFGKMPELGTLIKINDQHEFRIKGIMEDMPENTHFSKVDFLMDFPSIATLWDAPTLLTTYNNNSFGLYLLAKKGSNLKAKLPAMLEEFKKVNWMFKRGHVKTLDAEPITTVYFSKSELWGGIKTNSKTRIKVLSAIILLILLLAIVNYINLTISQAGFRSKETAIRKLLGGKKWTFVLQYICESIILCLIALGIALLLSIFAEPIVNELLDTKLHLQQAFSFSFIGLAVLFTSFVGIISGVLPALKISSFDPIAVVKGTFRMKEKRVYSRILIAFQYTLIIGLLSASLFIGKQTRYLQKFDVGFNKENIISLDNNLDSIQRISFKSEILRLPGVAHLCYVAGSPIDGGNNNSFTYKGQNMSFQRFAADTSFYKMMGLELKLTGVAYSENAWIFNEEAIKVLGLPENPTSFKFEYEGAKETPIYAVVKDFHFNDLHTKIGPAYLPVKVRRPWSILIKLNGTNVYRTVSQIKETYARFTNGIPTEPIFFDKKIESWYTKEAKLSKIVMYFTLLTIIISVMGLFAMSLYYVQQKTKEIGIRKVNGATITEILKMLNKDFVKWVIIAFVIAAPIAYYAMYRWLENFAYKTSLSWWIFALSGSSALLIALFTVSWQSWRAANRNPVEALRYE